jgi:hypothetical protein
VPDGGVRAAGRDENHAAALAEYGKQLLNQEIWRADIDRKELIEILDRLVRWSQLSKSCIGDKDVQAISNDAAGLRGKLAGAVRGSKVRRYDIRSATALAYLCDNTVGFLRAAAIVHENLGAGGNEHECARASHGT